MSNEIRIPATTIEMIQVLGCVLREHIQLQMASTECWTFNHVKDWQIRGKEPTEDASQAEWDQYMLNENPRHKQSVYLGEGYFRAFVSGDTPVRGRFSFTPSFARFGLNNYN